MRKKGMSYPTYLCPLCFGAYFHCVLSAPIKKQKGFDISDETQDSAQSFEENCIYLKPNLLHPFRPLLRITSLQFSTINSDVGHNTTLNITVK